MNYDSEYWVSKVKWDKDYQHVVDFWSGGDDTESKKRAQFRTLTAGAINHKTKYSPIFEKDGSGSIQVTGNHDNWVSYNYIIIRNPGFSDRVWYCFIDSVEYSAERTTIVYFTVDIWQTYHLDTYFYNSWIDRSHMSVADDILGENLEPEPFSVKPIVTRDIANIFSTTDWEPQWVLHTASYYNDRDTPHKYEYGGLAEDNTFGEYGRYIDTKDQVERMLEIYGKKSLDSIVDDAGAGISDFAHDRGEYEKYMDLYNETVASGHPNERYLEKANEYAERASQDANAIRSSIDTVDIQDHRDELIGLYAIPSWGRGGPYWATNGAVNKQQSLSLTTNMACGYTPKNKKMLSSVFKSYILYARNGTIIAYKPEAFTATPSLTCSCIPMGVSKYYAFMDKYGERDKQFIDIAYRSERRVGYDNNTGLNKAINIINAGEKVIGSGAALATGVIAENPAAILSGAQGLIGSSVSMIDALGQHESHFGSNGELLDITGGRAVLRWADVSASYNECVHMDKFLTAYGYAQNTIGNLYTNCRTRDHFNYIKSSDPNLRVDGTENVNEAMKQIFKNGTTIWHNVNYIYDYSVNN